MWCVLGSAIALHRAFLTFAASTASVGSLPVLKATTADAAILFSFFFSCCAVHHVQRVARELMRMCVSVLVWAPVIVTSFRALLCFHCLSFTRLAPLHLVAVRHSGVWRGHRIVHRIPCCFPVSGLFLSLFFPPLPLFCFKAVLLALLCSVFIGVLHRHAWVPLAKRVVRWGAGNGRTPFSVRFR